MPAPEALMFLDTCSLLETCWVCTPPDTWRYSPEKDACFWNKTLPKLQTIGRVIIPARVYDELEKHATNQGKPELAQRSSIVLEKLDHLKKNGGIEVFGDPNDPFADAIMLSVALKFRTQNNLLFVTQDRSLAHDLIAVANFQSVRPRKGAELKVRRISTKGTLEKHRNLENAAQQKPQYSPQPKTQASQPQQNTPPKERNLPWHLSILP